MTKMSFSILLEIFYLMELILTITCFLKNNVCILKRSNDFNRNTYMFL